MTKHVVVSQAEPIEDLADVSFRQPVMADYEGWDLQRLGTEFDSLYAKWLTLRWAADEAHAKWLDEVRKRGLHPDNDKAEFWALAEEIRETAMTLSNNALDALTPVTEIVRAVPAHTFQDIAVKLRVLRFEMAVYDDEPRKDQDWDDQCMNELIDEVHALAAQDPHQRLSLLAKEFKRTAAEAHPELTDWQLWEGKSVNSQHIDGKHITFFTLTGTRPS